ncbi:TIR domain-containing protein [Dokdonia sp.]|uniref:TIR domain-containing protein n=1 Tax=Dokdonia sp. TaxID=2024995 RepID=UPI003264CAA5
MTSESHKSYAGLVDIVGGSSNLNKGFEQLFHKVIEGKSNVYQDICIIDTFFSDTLHDDVLKFILEKSRELDFSVKIVLLNPFSESAIERAKHLSNRSRINRINLGLSKIKKALGGLGDKEPEYLSKCRNKNYIFKQIKQIENLKNENKYINLELRFTTVGRFPLYLFGQYACSGHFLDFASASESPWCFWVNDINESEDQYSNFINHFDEIWRESFKLDKEHFKSSAKKSLNDIFKPLKNNKVFIAYHDDNLKDIVKSICRDQKFIPKDYNTSAQSKSSDGIIPNIIKEMLNECSAAIIILTKDEQIEGEWRPRPNVLIELGLAQVRFPNRVLCLKEEGVSIGSNMSGHMIPTFIRNIKIGVQLEDAISRFLRKLRE